MKYKVGDRVRINSLDWYNENKDKIGFIRFNYANFIPEMSRYCGEMLTINQIVEEYKQYLVSECAFSWTDEMIEGLVEEEMSLDKAGQTTDFEYEGLAYTLPEGYRFIDENGNEILTSKIILEKKKKEYPKTYKECCKVLDIDAYDLVLSIDYRSNKMKHNDWKRLEKLNALNQILICRDAYWKMAGEEMGLGKPWEPDWKNDAEFKYVIICRKNCVIRDTFTAKDVILAFPTKEMRDAFYENFKELIEQCKELL